MIKRMKPPHKDFTKIKTRSQREITEEKSGRGRETTK